MQTAWQVLTSQSLLQSGTAWEHLNNQVGGNNTWIFNYACGVEVDMAVLEVSGSLSGANVEGRISSIVAEPSLEILETPISVVLPNYPPGTVMMVLEDGEQLLDEDGLPIIWDSIE